MKPRWQMQSLAARANFSVLATDSWGKMSRNSLIAYAEGCINDLILPPILVPTVGVAPLSAMKEGELGCGTACAGQAFETQSRGARCLSVCGSSWDWAPIARWIEVFKTSCLRLSYGIWQVRCLRRRLWSSETNFDIFGLFRPSSPLRELVRHQSPLFRRSLLRSFVVVIPDMLFVRGGVSPRAIHSTGCTAFRLMQAENNRRGLGGGGVEATPHKWNLKRWGSMTL